MIPEARLNMKVSGQEDITHTKKQELNWKEVYQMAFQCSKSAKLISFNFKLLFRRISTNNFLKKTGLVDSEKCTFYERETETGTFILGLPKNSISLDQFFKYGYSLAKSLPKRDP